MSTSTLIMILILLLVVLIPLLLSYIIYPDEKVSKHIPKLKKKVKEVGVDRSKPLSFDAILTIFSSKKSSKQELKDGIEQLIKHHGKIHAKLGDLPHPDFKRYREAIMAVCSNPKADKDVILAIDQKLRIKNPKYGLNIDEAVDKGIAKRGF